MRLIIILFSLLMLQACAFTDAQLEVAHSENVDIIGPISELDNLVFTQPEVADARTDKSRIGWKRNGFGQNTADITTEQSVEQIIEDALVDVINDNGHSVGDDGSLTITGTVDRFWFDMDVNFWTIEFFGDIQSTLQFSDTVTTELIYESSYQGTYKEEKAGGLEKTWTEVMAKAIDALIEEIVYDEDLAEALMNWRE